MEGQAGGGNYGTAVDRLINAALINAYFSTSAPYALCVTSCGRYVVVAADGEAISEAISGRGNYRGQSSWPHVMSFPIIHFGLRQYSVSGKTVCDSMRIALSGYSLACRQIQYMRSDHLPRSGYTGRRGVKAMLTGRTFPVGSPTQGLRL